MLTLFLATALAADPGIHWGSPSAAVTLAWGQHAIPQEETPAELYERKAQEALRSGKPIVIFVRTKAVEVPGSVVVEWNYQEGFEGITGRVTYVPDGKGWFTLKEERQVLPFVANPFQPASNESSLLNPRQTATTDDSLQERLVNLWPAEVEMPKGLKAYRPTRKSQRMAITNGMDSNLIYDKDQDDHWTNAPSLLNPNRQFPWAVPGGLDNAKGWESIIAVALPSAVSMYGDRVDVGARHPLPKTRWTFPEGTQFVDLLTYKGKPFELRTRTKIKGEWVSKKEYEDKTARPEGYNGLTKSCVECHQGAGSQLQYGISVRGDDGAFSWSPWDQHPK